MDSLQQLVGHLHHYRTKDTFILHLLYHLLPQYPNVASVCCSANEVEIYNALDRVLDIIRSENIESINIASVVNELVALLFSAGWLLVQSTLFGAIHVIRAQGPNMDDYLTPGKPLIEAIMTNFQSKKREVRDAASQAIGAVAEYGSQTAQLGCFEGLVQLTTKLESGEAKEGLVMAVGRFLKHFKFGANGYETNTLVKYLVDMSKYEDDSDFSRYIRLQAIRALNRALSSGLFAEDTKSSVIDAIGTRLEDSNIDVRREAAKLFGGLLTSETVHNAVIGLLSRLAKAEKWESRHGLCAALASIAEDANLARAIPENDTKVLYSDLSGHVRLIAETEDEPTSVTATANSEAFSAILNLFVSTNIPSQQPPDLSNAMSKLVVMDTAAHTFDSKVLPELKFLLHASEAILLYAGGRGITMINQHFPSLIASHKAELMRQVYKNMFHASNAVQEAANHTFDNVLGGEEAKLKFFEENGITIADSVLQECKKGAAEQRECAFKALAALFDKLSLLFASSSSSDSAPSPLDLVKAPVWRNQIWQDLVSGFTTNSGEEDDDVEEFMQSAALLTLQSYIRVTCAYEIHQEEHQRKTATPDDIFLSPRSTSFISSHGGRRSSSSPSLRTNALTSWNPTPSVGDVVLSIASILDTGSEQVGPAALRALEAIQEGWGRLPVLPVAGQVLTLSKVPDSSFRFDALRVRVGLLGQEQTLTIDQLGKWNPSEWLDPEETDEENLREGAISALLHVIQRLPRPTSRIPIPESDDSESDESSDGANEEEDPAADAIVEAFEIAMPALLRALCQDENVTNPVIQSRALATLFYFAELKCEKLAEHIRENAPLQHRLNLIIASMVHLVTRTTSEFEFDEDIVFDDDTEELDVSYPSSMDAVGVSIDKETPFFCRFIILGALVGYYLPLLTAVDPEKCCSVLHSVLSSIVARNPFYASAIPQMGNLNSFDLVKSMGIKDIDIRAIAALIKKLGADINNLLDECNGTEGSTEIAEKALSLAVKVLSSNNNCLHRIIGSHLLNLFHSQINLVGVKNISSASLRKYLGKLMHCIPQPNDEDVGETDDTDQAGGMDDETLSWLSLGKTTENKQGIPYGPFSKYFIENAVFDIVDGIWKAAEPLQLLTSVMEDLDAIFSDEVVDETDSKLIALLTHCVSEPYFDASLESILLPSCIKYVLDSTQIQNEQYPLVVGLLREVVRRWPKEVILKQDRDWFANLLTMAQSNMPELIQIDNGNAVVDILIILRRLLTFGINGIASNKYFELLVSFLANDCVDDETKLRIEPLLDDITQSIDPLFLPRPGVTSAAR